MGQSLANNKGNLLSKLNRFKMFYLLMLPGFLFLIVFRYVPMLGLRYAFYDFDLRGLGDFIGFSHFRDAFTSDNFIRAFKNTLILSSLNIVIQMTLIVSISLLLNEIKNQFFKKVVQTVIYLPHFLSWVVVGAVFNLLLSRQGGLVNEVVTTFGGEAKHFLGDQSLWRQTFLFILSWREIGWGTVIFLAALSGIDPQLYEAAKMDGANRWKQMVHITFPHLIPTIIIVLIMNLAKIFNLFESVFVLYNPLVYKVSDVIQTYTYRTGVTEFRFGYGTAVGLTRSVIAFVLVMGTNQIVKRLRGESVL
ncbi:sugar ABC transporter permease [Thiospirochaeta perfilievii]|uniref:Sugar ABC transporter permease n=1 Tax=Thiospirochaeta perfilievii TaxID=252967 RepID=A0A5C1QA14_9SPIO|nr:ABC transporter permease subunit [Thiospirochaeta perfilievii]QEN04321.1 sugar ABC transporter permease [Thiospirochaeta perfilievii]